MLVGSPSRRLVLVSPCGLGCHRQVSVVIENTNINSKVFHGGQRAPTKVWHVQVAGDMLKICQCKVIAFENNFLNGKMLGKFKKIYYNVSYNIMNKF